ncbi:MAG: hypothetical protein OEO21_09035 [Candidatus Krumholzibacteria bacterium]|nr:hypothetical protein [Candidatus Krumholzibacteria bacterium]
MKSVLAVVLAVALIGLGAHSANAQLPYVQAYFSVDPYTTGMNCPGPGTQELFVVAHNYNTFLIAAEFSVSLPPALAYLGFTSSAQLSIGDPVLAIGGASAPGVTLSWPYPQNAFVPFLFAVLQCFWTCDDCLGGPEPLAVMPHGVSQSLTIVSWPALVADTRGIGMVSIVCPDPVPVEETSWGQIKALYEE